MLIGGWVLGVLTAIAVLAGLPTAAFAAPTATPVATSAPKAKASPTATASATPTATPTRVPPTATAVPPTPTSVLQVTATPTAVPPGTVSIVATARPTSSSSTAVAGTGVVHGQAFVDANADGALQDSEVGLAHVDVKLTLSNGLSRSATTDEHGAFDFEGLSPGMYRVSVTVPSDYVATTDQGQDVEVVPDAEIADVVFGLLSLPAAGLNPDG